jgi:hypothetical protein
LKLTELPRWRKVEIVQSLFGFAMLLVVFSVSFFYYGYEPPEPVSSESINKLSMASGVPQSSVVTTIPIKIWVIDKDGQINRSRDDVIQINMALSPALRLKESKVTLVNGEATVEVIGFEHGGAHTRQNVLFTAVWVSGDSYLESAKMVLVYPPLGAGG